ncbi:MAG: (2Fe-2S)-binding protein [Chloroflexi bacterium]|nr:(2Fe-2S)-binding protein [Chloroflexota bacterium]
MLTLTINGQDYDFDADVNMPLLWVLRDLLGLTGTKYGCGMGLCGSCTVHIDGHPRHACVTPVGNLEGETIVTIEGLASDEHHPLQKVWLDEFVSQCGYCQPGQLMTAAALLASSSNLTDAEIDDAMSGVLCRCGTYQRIRKAIRRAVEEA